MSTAMKVIALAGATFWIVYVLLNGIARLVGDDPTITETDHAPTDSNHGP